jgi:hypothetical protein
MMLEFPLDERKKPMEVLITANALSGGDRLAILVIEDITELSALRDILPICAKCKKIRNDQQYWQRIESYLHDHIGVEFTHSLCPTCVADFYAESGIAGPAPK